MIGKHEWRAYLRAHIERAKALKEAKNATDPAVKMAAQEKLLRAQARLNETRGRYEEMLQESPDRDQLKLSQAYQQLLNKADTAYEQYQRDNQRDFAEQYQRNIRRAKELKELGVLNLTDKQKARLEQYQRDIAAYEYEQYQRNIRRAKELAVLNLVDKEKVRLEDVKKNREALSSALMEIRKKQHAKKVSHRKHRANYVLSHRFYVEMDSVIRAAFNECSGFGLDVKKEVYLEGGVNHQQRVMLGHAEFQDTVLKRGMTNDSSFWLWIKEILDGRVLQGAGWGGSAMLARTRRNINILMMNQSGAIMQVCTLVGAIPVGWKAPAFQADSAAVAIEEMTLAYEGIHLHFQTGTEALAAGGATTLLMRDELGFFPDN